jgi:SAM-dependent methyltransferase
MAMEWGSAGSFPERYEEIMVTAFFQVFAEDLVARLSPKPGDRLLDVACGTGVVLRAALAGTPDLGRLVGLDLTPAMLAVARERVGDGAELVEGDAQQLPFGEDEFDVVTCQQGLQFVPDKAAALAEIGRVATSGARIAIACWQGLDTQPGAAAMFEAGREHLSPDIANVGLAPFAMGREELGRLVEAAGFEDVVTTDVTLDSRYDSAERFVEGFERGSPMALALATVDPDEVTRWREAAVGRLKQYEGPEGVVLPMTTTLVTATAS